MDVNCGWEMACQDCCDSLVFPDGNVVGYVDRGTWVYQLTDHNITAGYKYTITLDSMTDHAQPMDVSFYWLDDVCYPDANHNDLSTTRHIVTGYEYDWEYGLTAQFVAEAGQACVGEKLGIKFESPITSRRVWVDDVRLSWK